MEHKEFYPDFIKHHDDIVGLDRVSIYIDEHCLSGYFKNSPLEKRMINQFKLNINEKPYRGAWLVIESELYLLYVNGVFNNIRLYTYDILPEHPDDDEEGNAILYHYKLFTGDLILINQQYVVNPIFEPYIINETEYLLSFKEGDLITK
jgi:hypothetical protein